MGSCFDFIGCLKLLASTVDDRFEICFFGGIDIQLILHDLLKNQPRERDCSNEIPGYEALMQFFDCCRRPKIDPLVKDLPTEN